MQRRGLGLSVDPLFPARHAVVWGHWMLLIPMGDARVSLLFTAPVGAAGIAECLCLCSRAGALAWWEGSPHFQGPAFCPLVLQKAAPVSAPAKPARALGGNAFLFLSKQLLLGMGWEQGRGLWKEFGVPHPLRCVTASPPSCVTRAGVIEGDADSGATASSAPCRGHSVPKPEGVHHTTAVGAVVAVWPWGSGTC